MRIILATCIFYPEPIAMSQIIKDIAIKLNEVGHEVAVVTSFPCRPYGYDLPKVINESCWKFKRIILPSFINPKSEFIGRYRENFSFGKAFVKYIDENHNNIDVIYACVFPLFCQRMIVRTAKKYSIPVIMHVEDIYPEPFTYMLPFIGKLVYKILLPIDRYILQNSAKVVAIGPRLRDYLIKTRDLLPSKTEFVYNWQDERRFAKHNNETQNKHKKFTFMYCGSLSTAANLEYILEAFIESNVDDARIVFAGSGVLKNKLIAIANNNVNVEFWDAPSSIIGEIQSKADVLILPLVENMAKWAYPSKFPAYLFSAKPVLASVDLLSDVADAITNSKCGWVISPDDKKSLIDLLKKIPKMEEKTLLTIANNGFSYSQKHFLTNINLSKMVSIIESVKE